jgi:hypothetical protein
VKTRQNPLNKFESFMQHIIEGPFAFLFPTRLQPAQVARRLERAMEDGALNQGDGWYIAPEIYDIYVSIKDHQQMQAVEAILKQGWENQLVQFARMHNYTLRVNPILRLHARANLRVGDVQIETAMIERGSGAESGIMHTQQLSREELERLKAGLAPGQVLPGITSAPNPSQPNLPLPGPYGGYAGSSSMPANASGMPPPMQPMQPYSAPPMPQAWLTIRLPHSPEKKDYRIDRPVVSIGRQLTNDIIVEDKRVSRYHAQIKYVDGQFIIYDLDSVNGITVNGVPSIRQHVLQNGDRFTIGSYDFYFQRR